MLYSFTMQANCYCFNHFVSLFVYLSFPLFPPSLHIQGYSKSSHAPWGICATTCSTVNFNILCQITCFIFMCTVKLSIGNELLHVSYWFMFAIYVMIWSQRYHLFEKLIWTGVMKLEKSSFIFWGMRLLLCAKLCFLRVCSVTKLKW